MSTQRSHHRTRHWMATPQAGERLGRLATVLAAVTTGLLLASAAAAPVVFADRKLAGRRGATATTA